MVISDSNRLNDVDRRLDKPGPTRMKSGLVGSLVLHSLVLMLFGLSWTMQKSPQIIKVVPINLVRLGPQTVSQPSSQTALVPQDKAKALPKSETAEVMAMQTVERHPVPHEAAQPAAPTLPTTDKPMQKPDIPETAGKSASRPTTAITRAHRLSPNEELAARLKQLSRLRQAAPRTLRSAQQQEGAGMSNVTVASADMLNGRDARYAVKDFIRAQVERRWNLNRTQIGANDWVVAIHIILQPDGTVRLAQIVGNPRFLSIGAYHDFALSARDAVLLSSPLALPPGTYAIAKDIVVSFDSRQVLQ